MFRQLAFKTQRSELWWCSCIFFFWNGKNWMCLTTPSSVRHGPTFVRMLKIPHPSVTKELASPPVVWSHKNTAYTRLNCPSSRQRGGRAPWACFSKHGVNLRSTNCLICERLFVLRLRESLMAVLKKLIWSEFTLYKLLDMWTFICFALEGKFDGGSQQINME